MVQHIVALGKLVFVGWCVAGLVACAGSKVTHSQVASSFGEGNVLQNSAGEKITFLSINKEPLGNISSVTVNANDLVVKLKNPNTGRQATVRVSLDPSSRKFITVNATRVSYMCYDDQADPCSAQIIPAGYTLSGTSSVNCSSPIFFTGAISGSVDNITQERSASCGR